MYVCVIPNQTREYEKLNKQIVHLFTNTIMEWGEFKTLETRLTVSKRKTQNCICFSYLIWKKVLHLSQGNFFLSTFYLLFIDSISTFDHQVALGCKQAAWGNQNSSCSHLSAFNKVLSIRHSFQWWPLLSVFLSAFYIFLLSCLHLVSLASALLQALILQVS